MQGSDEPGESNHRSISKLGSYLSEKMKKSKNKGGADKKGESAPCALSEDGLQQQIARFIQYIETHGGLELEGLYRVSGNKSVAEGILRRSRIDPTWDLSDDDYSVTAVTTALKQLVKELPQPLIPAELRNYVINACGKSL